jgi:hypothetical protein
MNFQLRKSISYLSNDVLCVLRRVQSQLLGYVGQRDARVREGDPPEQQKQIFLFKSKFFFCC